MRAQHRLTAAEAQCIWSTFMFPLYVRNGKHHNRQHLWKMQVAVILKMSGSLEDNDFLIKEILFRWKVLCWDKRWKILYLSPSAEPFGRNSAGILNLSVQVHHSETSHRDQRGRSPFYYTSSHTFKKLSYLTAKKVPCFARKWYKPRCKLWDTSC